MLNFEKYADGLVPAVVQDAATRVVLMVGFMNREALEKTTSGGLVTFFSRSRKTLWTKGETSGNFLKVSEVLFDCDEDTILIKATPSGGVCHTGAETCFDEKNSFDSPLHELERVILERKTNPTTDSYTSQLLTGNLNKTAQKVGEEAVEVVIEAVNGTPDLLKEETADLLYHLLVLLAAKNVTLDEVLEVLRLRRMKEAGEK
jgi:phosphoribosyl-ATP pyrophosphohydrolase/phosphoribosyl-AMP cyclohydrolase